MSQEEMRDRGLENHGGAINMQGLALPLPLRLFPVPGISRLRYETTTTLGSTITDHQRSLDIPIVPIIHLPGPDVTITSSRTLFWLHLVPTKRSAIFYNAIHASTSITAIGTPSTDPIQQHSETPLFVHVHNAVQLVFCHDQCATTIRNRSKNRGIAPSSNLLL